MKELKKILSLVIVISFILTAGISIQGEVSEDFLRGNIHFLDKAGASLDKRMEAAGREFNKTNQGSMYFTGYTFISRHSIHMNHDGVESEPYSINVRSGEIKIRRKSKDRKQAGFSTRKEEKHSAPAGILVLHSKTTRNSEIIGVHIFGLDNSYEFQDIPLYWLGEAENKESLKLLNQTFESGKSEFQKSLLFLISSHDDPKAVDFLNQVALGSYPIEVRSNAIFWLGNYKDENSLKILKAIYKEVNEFKLKKQVVFALQLSDHEDAIREIIRIAKTDSSQKVRKNAVFWMGQKASQLTVNALEDVIAEPDEEIEVKKSAVFAISQLPKERSIPMLMDIIKSHHSPDLRKNAIFWLGQTGDEEALKFFEELLLKK